MSRLLLLTALAAALATAGVRRVEIAARTAVLDGQPFGKAGPYERIVGRAHFGLNPSKSANHIVRDLEFAPVNASGEVECAADFYILQPRDLSKGNGTILFEVSNRGGKGMLNRFDFAHGAADPESADDFGDRWLLEEGYTLVWLGWEWDIPEANRTALHFAAPHFRDDALPARGLVRSEFFPDRKVETMPLSDRGQTPIAVGKALALYMSDSPDSAAHLIARGNWKLAPGGDAVETEGGFEPGKMYQFVYEGKDPVVAGTGLAAVRDWISFLKYGGMGTLGDEGRHLKRAIGFGISQSGRFLREFLYDGFNADEQGRQVFDAVWADVAGAGRGSFNFRYAQPSRDGHPFLNVLYPTDLFPFTDAPEVDLLTGRTGGLLVRAHAAGVEPKLFLTNNSYEYWGRVAGLISVTPDGKSDAPLSPATRFYFVAGVQHFPRSLPLVKAGTRYLVNPVDHRPVQRALLADLEAWVAAGTPPPDSVYPRLAAGQLTPPDKLAMPHIEGVEVPRYPRPARRLEFGPDFATKGIIGREPPQIGASFPVLVPQVDSDGIDLGGIRLPEVAVPLATITGWNLRAPDRGAPDQIAEFYGSIFPFAVNKEAREKNHDPRPSIAERYPSREEYLKRASAAADRLIGERFLLPQDKSFVVERAAHLWDALMR
jgi:hypothetical protein